MKNSELLDSLFQWICPYEIQYPINSFSKISNEDSSNEITSTKSNLLIINSNQTNKLKTNNSSKIWTKEDCSGQNNPVNELKKTSNLFETIRYWTQPYLEEIQLQILDALCKLGPQMIEDCFKYNIPHRLMTFLHWCTSPGR